MNALQFQSMSKVYGAGPSRVEALREINLTIAPGQTVALVGASGSGKTTLLNLAAGFDRPTTGAIRLATFELANLGEVALAKMRRTQVGFLFQSLNLLPTLSAGENIQLALELAAVPKADQAERISTLLQSAALADKARTFCEALSAGERQRIAVLRALAHRPGLLLMDEPTSCLDTPNADQLMELVLELNRAEGTAMVLTTHDMRVAQRMQRIVRLHDGRIIDDDVKPD